MRETKLEPVEAFNVLRHTPSLQSAFRDECYITPQQESLDHTPEKKYDHTLGIAFLKKHGIPTTREGLQADSKYYFRSVKDGDVRYNVGQFIVLFSNAIHSSGSITNDNVWVLEVMSEFDFPADKPLLSLAVEDIQLALKDYLDTGIVKLHKAGHRMYDVDFTYEFAERINSVAV